MREFWTGNDQLMMYVCMCMYVCTEAWNELRERKNEHNEEWMNETDRDFQSLIYKRVIEWGHEKDGINSKAILVSGTVSASTKLLEII